MAAIEGSPALGVVELEHIARGMLCTDVLSKRADVEILAARPVSGGKFLIFLRGEVAELEEAMDAARECGAESLVDSLFLPYCHQQLWPAICDPIHKSGWGAEEILSVGILESATICSALAAMDGLCKSVDVTIQNVQLGVGIHGKAYFTWTGELNEVLAGLEVAKDIVGEKLLSAETIASPAPEITGQLIV